MIPLETLTARAAANPAPLADERDELARQLLRWFKKDFFKWVNNPPCDHCGSAKTHGGGGAQPTPAEAAAGAGRVETYTCADCGGTTRFPRYNDPGKLLETRRGRCGEWANCFTLCCRALGYEARWVRDWTDHVWTEVYSAALGRWVHADPCEAAWDAPLTYEAGWNKKLTYVVAFGRDHVVDVSRRYTRKLSELLPRRTLAPEGWLELYIAQLNATLRGGMDAARRAWLEPALAAEAGELAEAEARGGGGAEAGGAARPADGLARVAPPAGARRRGHPDGGGVARGAAGAERRVRPVGHRQLLGRSGRLLCRRRRARTRARHVRRLP